MGDFPPRNRSHPPERGDQSGARPAFSGFPSPADDFTERRIDLNEYLIRHKEATFFLRAQGERMVAAGIHDGDLLIVDRSLTPKCGDVIVVATDGRLKLERLPRKGELNSPQARDARRPDSAIGAREELVCWGVVCWSIHRV